MRRTVAATLSAAALGAGAFLGTASYDGFVVGDGDPTSLTNAALVPQAKLAKVAGLYHRELAKVHALRRTLRRHPDFDVSLQLAGTAYGQDWRALKRCALSEGARQAERFRRHNQRPNNQGSGAFSSFQFMRGTFLSTPYARLDWSRQDVQAHAAAWMFSVGRRREWAGAGC